MLPNRQIHLDFHTNGMIGNVAGKFDAHSFANTLQHAEVDGICLFARCHHGYCYYPTKHGIQHPHLKEPDLLDKQIKACHKAGIQAWIYTTICWDEFSANNHPEWLAQTTDNQIMKMNPYTGQQMSKFEAGWQFLCWNSPYREYFKGHIKELLSIYNTIEYLFLDILFHRTACVCRHCISRMTYKGLSPENPQNQEQNSIDSAREFMQEVNELIYSFNPNIKPFYNSRLRVTGNVQDGSRPELNSIGYLCIESLPSGPWGYDHFPIFAKYFQNFASDDKPIKGHNWKFQKMWGDFGGLKNQAALDYEVMRMVSHGVAASVGDQLHPEGILDNATYKLIGNTFKKVKDIEKYLLPSKPIDEIGVLFTNKPQISRNIGTELDSETGAMKLLTQLQYQFSFLDEESEFSAYKLLILPDAVILNDKLNDKINSYLSSGGKVLLSYNSGLNKDDKWSIKQINLQVNCNYEYNPYYIYPSSRLLNGNVVEDTDHIQYLGGKAMTILDDSYEILAKITEPYFNRTWDHFCSHAQTPPAKRTQDAEMVFNNKNVVYFASPVFSCYNRFSPKVIKQMVDFGIRQLLGDKLIESNLPSTAELTLRKNKNNQIVLSILNYVPQCRGVHLEIVEDIISLRDIEISLLNIDCLKVFDRVYGKKLDFDIVDFRLKIDIPRIEGFTVITIE